MLQTSEDVPQSAEISEPKTASQSNNNDNSLNHSDNSKTTPISNINVAPRNYDSTGKSNNSPIMTPKLGQKGNISELSSKGLVLVTWCIIATEFCERLAFYGISGNLELFLKREFGLTTALASSYVALWTGACYLTTLLGGWLADAYLNRYFAILIFAFLYLIGLIGISFVSWKTQINNRNENLEWIYKFIFWISLYIVAFGTGM